MEEGVCVSEVKSSESMRAGKSTQRTHSELYQADSQSHLTLAPLDRDTSGIRPWWTQDGADDNEVGGKAELEQSGRRVSVGGAVEDGGEK